MFEQAGSTLNLFADRNTRNDVPRLEFSEQLVPVGQPALRHHLRAGVRLAVDPPVLSRQGARSPVKFAIGLLLVGAGFVVLIPPASRAQAGMLVSPGWLLLTYLLHTLGELASAPSA